MPFLFLYTAAGRRYLIPAYHYRRDGEYMKIWKKSSLCLLVLCLVLSFSTLALAATVEEVDAAVDNTAQYLLKTVTDPQVGSIGGEWAVIGLARWNGQLPADYIDGYYDTLVETLQQKQGVLDEKKYTEYARVILALTAIGEDPANVGGYNLLEKLADYDQVVWQGINGPIFALLALDCGDYAIPQAQGVSTQATRELYLQAILDKQLADGGFALGGDTADADITAMALQALANYQDRTDVKAATEKALACLSSLQDAQGGFGSWGTKANESTCQVLVALCELGIDVDDSRFVKNGNTVVDDILDYYQQDQGFVHTQSGAGNSGMATEQAFYALVSYLRVQAGQNALYQMSDVEKRQTEGGQTTEGGLSGKDPAVQVMPVVSAGKTFSDIQGHANQQAIEALAARAIINGDTPEQFAPDRTMTRAEFATIVTKALGLTAKASGAFDDVAASAWYAPYIGTAYEKGIVKGTGANRFSPNASITREEAAVMVARAASLCGMETSLTETAVRDMLAQFTDYTQCADWSKESLAFCYQEDILSQDDLEIQPQTAIKRCEIAEMIYRMLQQAKLL